MKKNNLKIAVASGKGGTGKTTIATNLALVLSKEGSSVTYLDCDVEEPNGHIFLRPQITKRKPVTLPIPEVDLDKCTFCGKCGEICQHSAIAPIGQKVLVFPDLCSGCGGCSLVCPEDAIVEVEKEIGIVEEGNSNGIRFIHGILNIGQAKSPPVIKEVKSGVVEKDISIIDSPPGTSCPVIESVRDSDFVILVTEPTPFGLNDLILAVDMLKALKIPFGVVINREDIGDFEVHNYCKSMRIPVIGTIPDDLRVARAYSNGEMAVTIIPEFNKVYLDLFNLILEVYGK